MTDTLLYVLWGGFYILSIVLGFIPDAVGFVRVFLIVMGATVFLPPAILLYRGRKELAKVRLVRNVSIISLSATLVLMVLNLFSVYWPELVGDFVYFLLAVVSAPMLCMQFKVVGMFCWACLLMASLEVLRAQKKAEK